jgi:hypothetical protein
MNQANSNIDTPSKSDVGHTLIGAVKFLTLVSALLAILGPLTAAYYHYGQLSAFNLSESIFPVQLADTPMLLHRTLLSIVGNAFVPLLYAPTLIWYALLFGLMMSAGLYIVFYLRKPGTAKKNEWLKKHLGKPILMSFFGGVFTGTLFYIIPWIFLLCSSFIILLPMTGYYAGMYDGKEFLTKWKECGKAEVGLRQRCTTVNVLVEQPGGQKSTASYTGEIVVGNDKWLGIVTDTEILTLPASLQTIRVGRIIK